MTEEKKDYGAVRLSENGYMARAKNGVTVLFYWRELRFLEGHNDDKNPSSSYFIIDEEGDIFLINEKDMFELVKMNFIYPARYRDDNLHEFTYNLLNPTWDI
jgi:hypothetical protein